MKERRRGLKKEFKELVTNFKEHLLVEKSLLREGIKKREEKDSLKRLAQDLKDCQRCRLSQNRTHLVLGEGSPQARLMFIGEGPGRDEDLVGRPFVGKAGQLLTRIIKAIKLSRKEVYITNVVKCRPPQNRGPYPDEMAACEEFLFRQIELIKPRLIVALGNYAAQSLLKTEQKISSLRGLFQDFRGIKVMPTYHPAFLLRNPQMKRPVWEDMQKVEQEYFRVKG